MDDEIKSAYEIAMEKVAKMGDASEEERLKWKYVPEGEKLAAKLLKGKCTLSTELGKYEDKVTEYVKMGIATVLIKNIDVPKDDTTSKNNEKAMNGIKELKKDKDAVEAVFSQMRNIFNHYAEQGEQQKQQAYEALKAEFAAKIQQAVQQQMGNAASGMKIDVEKQPQFQEEWRKVRSQLDGQYYHVLDEQKKQLSEIE